MAMVSSLWPSAAPPCDVWLKDQEPGLEKSSLKSISPRLGRKSGVGVTGLAGIGVGVAVGGNQTTVAVTSLTGVGDSEETVGGVSTGAQALKVSESRTDVASQVLILFLAVITFDNVWYQVFIKATFQIKTWLPAPVSPRVAVVQIGRPGVEYGSQLHVSILKIHH